jgi:uncharacterized OsmC-like protein
MGDIDVLHAGGDRFDVRIRGHRVVVDQPATAGGGDAGPTPTELFVAGLAACTGFYAERYLRRHGLSSDGLRVACQYGMSEERPARVDRIDLRVNAPSLPPARRAAFQAVIEHCTVHNSLRQPPRVEILLSGEEAVA